MPGVYGRNGPGRLPRFVSGHWYPAGEPGSLAGTITNNRMYAIPFWVSQDCTITGLAVNMTTAATTGGSYFAIYDDDGNGRPSTQLYESGSITVNSVAVKSVNPNLSVSPRLIWVGFGAHFSAGTGVYTMITSSDYWLRASTATTPVASDFSTAHPGAYFDAHTSLVTETPNNPFVIDGSTNVFPLILVKVA
jgi:hypothetical protein